MAEREKESQNKLGIEIFTAGHIVVDVVGVMHASCVTRLLSCFAGGEQIAHTATYRPSALRLIATRAGKGVYVALGGAHSTAALIGPKVVGLHLQVVAVDFRSRAGRAQIIVSEG